MSESEEISGTQLDPRQKYCRLILLAPFRIAYHSLGDRGSLHTMFAFASNTQAPLADRGLPLEPTRSGRSSGLNRTSSYRTRTLSPDERCRAHDEADLESALCYLSDG